MAMSDLDSRVQNLEIRMGIAENNINKIEKKLDKIDNNTSKIIWLIISTIILAVLASIFKGGLLK